MGGFALRKSESLSELSRGHPSPDTQKYHTIQTIARTAPTFTKATSIGITLTPTAPSAPPPLGTFGA